MTLTLEQVSRILFLVSNLRYWEREYANDPNWYKRNEVIRLQVQVDQWLKKNEVYEYKSSDEIIEILTAPSDQWNLKKKAV